MISDTERSSWEFLSVVDHRSRKHTWIFADGIAHGTLTTIKMVRQLKNKADYEGFVQENSEGIAVVCFTAGWSGPCRMFANKYKEISDEYSNVAFAQIDTEGNEALVSKHGVELLPAFCFYKNGKKVGKTIRGDDTKVRNVIDNLRLK